jgi:SAM-dependent methyltransferase
MMRTLSKRGDRKRVAIRRVSEAPLPPRTRNRVGQEVVVDACPSCCRAPLEFWRFAHTGDPRRLDRRAYALRRCRTCGTASLAPDDRPKNKPAIYGEPTSIRAPLPVRPFQSVLRRLRDRERMRLLRGIPQGARVFEVGSGDGRFLAAITAAGHEAVGCEPYRSPDPSVAGRIHVLRQPLEELELLSESQDVVVLWHVLEHLDDPAHALRRLHACLAPGGRLILAVPNLASLQARIGGTRWFHQDVPRHVVHFTTSGLVQLLDRCGFHEPRIHKLMMEQNVVSMWQTLLNSLTRAPNVALGLVKRRVPGHPVGDVAITVLLGVLLLPVAALLELGAGLLGRGGSIVIEARKGA